MKNVVKEFIELSYQEKQELWNNCTFVFDTNVFLNLYRYSARTRDTLIDALIFLKDRVWMPNHVAYEFMNRRCEVIFETVDRYDKLIKEKDLFTDKVANTLRLNSTDTDVTELDAYISNWIKKQKDENLLVINYNEDSVLEKLLDIFNNKTGSPYNDDTLSKIKAEGKIRYAKLIPPGYKDSNKKNSDNDNNMYGDLIIWKQILEYSKNNSKNIIYVTHDQKPDWWNIVSGKTIGPRIELRKEFIEYTKGQFHMYSMNSFIEIFYKQKGIKKDKSVMREVLHFELENNKMLKNKNSVDLENSITNLSEKIARSEKAVLTLEKKYAGKSRPKNIEIQIKNTNENIRQLKKKLIYFQQKYRLIRNQEFHDMFVS